MLTVCSSCRRHIRSPEACPFCARRKRARQAGLAFVAAATLAACQSQTPEQPAIAPDQANAPAETTPADATAAQPDTPAPNAEPVAEATEKPVTSDAPDTTTPADPAAEKPGGATATKPTTTSPITASSYKRPVAMRYGLAPRPRPKPKQPVKK